MIRKYTYGKPFQTEAVVLQQKYPQKVVHFLISRK